MTNDEDWLAGIRSQAGKEMATTIEWAADARDLMVLGEIPKPVGMDDNAYDQVISAIRDPFTMGKSETKKALDTLRLFGLGVTSKARDYLNVADFGARGDGVTNDTFAIQAAINAAAPGTTLNFPGTYSINTITINTDRLTLTGPGTLVSRSEQFRMLTITGDGVTLRGLTIDGNLLAREAVGVEDTEQLTTIDDCTISRCRGLGARGIFTSTRWGVKIKDCRITDISGTGFVRAISITCELAALAPSFIENNYISDILGNNVGEADGIAILFSTAGAPPFVKAMVTVQGNFIENCSRRFLKVQARDVNIFNNKFNTRDGFLNDSTVSFVIGLIQSHEVYVEGNDIQCRVHNGPISIAGASGDLSTDVFVTGNTIREQSTTKSAVQIAWTTRCTVMNNLIIGGSFYVYGENSTDLIVMSNKFQGGHGSNNATALTSTVTVSKVAYNTAPLGRPIGTSAGVTFTGNI